MSQSRSYPIPATMQAFASLLAVAIAGLGACAPDLVAADSSSEGGEDLSDLPPGTADGTAGLGTGMGTAVASDGTGDLGTSTGGDGMQLPGGSHITHIWQGDHYRTQVDATDREAWLWLDVDTGTQVAEPTPGWDLGFRRFEFPVNGGVSGASNVAAAWVEGFSALQVNRVPPPESFVTDEADADADGKAELALADWYDYDVETHILTPKLGSYVLRSGEGRHYAIQFESYYSDTGTPAMVTFIWREISAP